MSKRRAPADSPPAVDDSKRSKQDLPSEKLAEEKPHEPVDEIREIAASAPEPLEYIQMIITGPRGCGKSCLVLSYLEQLLPPSGVDFLSKQYLHILPNDQSLMIWDLDSRDEFRRYRQQSYQEADVALLCFDVRKQVEGDERDLLNLLRPWIDEIGNNCGKIPTILVGLKGDSRSNSNFNYYNMDDVKYVLRRNLKIDCNMYKEVSAYLNREGVKELFASAIDKITRPKPKEMFANCGFEIIGPRWLM